jgi:hypothetical protein
MSALLKKRRGRVGVSSLNAYSYAWRVKGSGMIDRRTESGSVLNDVISDQAKGTNMRSA